MDIVLGRLWNKRGTLQDDLDDVMMLNQKLREFPRLLVGFVSKGGILYTLQFMYKYRVYEGYHQLASDLLGFVSSQTKSLSKGLEHCDELKRSLLFSTWSQVMKFFSDKAYAMTEIQSKSFPIPQLWALLLVVLRSVVGAENDLLTDNKDGIVTATLLSLRAFKIGHTSESMKTLLQSLCLVSRDQDDLADDMVREQL